MDVGESFSKEFIAEGVVHAPTGIAMFTVPGYQIKVVNPFCLSILGRMEGGLIDRPLFEVMPGVRKIIEPLFRYVELTGEPCYRNELEIKLNRDGRVEPVFANLICQPIKGNDGVIESIMVVINEVTELVRDRRRVWESEEKLRGMMMKSTVAMAILRGKDWIIEQANEAILKNFWRRELNEVQGRKLLDAFPELTGQSATDLIHRVFETGTPHCEKEKPVFVEDSACAFADLECTPLFDHGQSVSGVLLKVCDVSEEVMSRRRTEENEQRLKMVIEASGLGTWELNLKTDEFHYSDEYLATFGVKERLSHTALLRFMHPDDLPRRQEAFRQAFATGWLHYTSRILWRDGSTHWIEAHGKVILDEDGKPSKMIGTSRDITEEKLFQQSIQESEEKFRLFAASIPHFIWTGDANGSLNYFNQSVYDYCGMTFEQLKGQGWIEIVHPDDRAANLKKWLEAVRKGGDFLFEHRFRRHDGAYRWQLSRAVPRYDAQGNIQMWVGTSTDIHDQKTFEKELEEKVFERTRELKETNEMLEKTNRDLEQFAYIASHDLQEPLRKIQTFADMLKKNIHDPVSVHKYFSKIDSSAKRMADLIKSVLDYSRIPIHPGQLVLTDLNEIVEHVKADFELAISDRTAIVECSALPAVPGVPLQLQQLFSNLIGNALKFCRNNPVINIWSVVVPGYELTWLFKADENKRYVEVHFVDNGIGFENRYKEQIFTIFQRLHGWQQYSGTGIGLALCKKIVENHQGYITAESEPGKGSTFIVYLPAS